MLKIKNKKKFEILTNKSKKKNYIRKLINAFKIK